MCKKLIYLMTFVLVLALAGNASATNYSWDGGGDGSSWNDSSNWNVNGVPGSADKAAFGSGNPVVTTSESIFEVEGGGSQTLTIRDGGYLDADYNPGSCYWLGGVAGGNASIDVYDGTLDIGLIYVGFQTSGNSLNLLDANAVVQQTDRYLNIAFNGGTGHVQLDAGLLDCVEFRPIESTGTASIDFAGGTMILNGEWTNLQDTTGGSGLTATAYGGDANYSLYYDYNSTANETTITATASLLPVIAVPDNLQVFEGGMGYCEVPDVQPAAKPIISGGWTLIDPCSGSEPNDFVFDSNTGKITWTPDMADPNLLITMTAENANGTSDSRSWYIRGTDAIQYYNPSTGTSAPFFSFGWYVGNDIGPGQTEWDLITDSNANMVQLTSLLSDSGVDTFLDNADSAGFKVIPSLHPNLLEGVDPGDPCTYTAITAIVGNNKEHPAVLGWKMGDEQESGGDPNDTVNTATVIRALDANNQIWQVFAGLNNETGSPIIPHLPGTDVTGLGQYFETDGGGEFSGSHNTLMHGTYDTAFCANHNLPCPMGLQGMGGDDVILPSYRFPTSGEMRWNVFSALAAGARGIDLFLLPDQDDIGLWYTDPNDFYDFARDTVGSVFGELEDIKHAMETGYRPGRVTLDWALKESDKTGWTNNYDRITQLLVYDDEPNCYYLILTNNASTTQDVNATLHDLPVALETLNVLIPKTSEELTLIDLNDGDYRLDDSLGDHEVIVYQIGVSASASLPWSEGFESGDFTAGGWTKQNNDASVSNQADHNGTYGAQLKKTTWIETAKSTEGYSTIHVKYCRETSGFDSGENLYVEWYDNDSNDWVNLETIQSADYTDGQQDKTCDPNANDNADFKLRFRTNASKANEKAYIDCIEITGTEI